MKLLFEKGTCGTKRQRERGGGGGGGGRDSGERSGAPSDATGSLHSLLPNKAKAGQAGEKMMPNCQQSQHLKSLPSLLNKDTFLICSSKLFFKVISRIWGKMLTFLSQFPFPHSHTPPYLPRTRQRHLLFLL